MRPLLSLILVTSLYASVIAAEPSGRLMETIPLQIIHRPQIDAPSSSCSLKNHNDTVVAFYSGIGAGEKYASFFDPERCAATPTYPFDVQQIDLPLMSVVGATWPVQVTVEIRSATGGDSCGGPGILMCSETVSLDSASFALPHIGSIALTNRCTVNGPFFVAINYTGGTALKYPSVLFDSDMPGDSCMHWGFYQAVWYRWNHFFSPPFPGNIIMWVNGQTNSPVNPPGCCVGIRGNVSGDPGQSIDIEDLSDMIDYLFLNAYTPPCADEANVDGDPGGSIDISDLGTLVDYLFLSGPLPPGC